MPRPNISTGYVFTTPPGDRFSVDWRIDREPPLPQAFYPHCSFWIDAPGGPAAGSYGRGAYMGPQRLFSTARRGLIFSIWDDTARPGTGEAVPVPIHPEDRRNFDGGWGAHTGLVYPWALNTPYRLTVQHAPNLGLWLCTVTELASMKRTLVGAIEAEGTLANWCMTHYETLGGPDTCVGHGPAVVIWEHFDPPVIVQEPFWDGTCPDVLHRAQVGNDATAYVLR